MASIQTYICSFQPALRVGIVTEYLVPVSWWAYDDDRPDGRGPAKRVHAQVSVKAYTAGEARKLVAKEWGQYSGSCSIGTPEPA